MALTWNVTGIKDHERVTTAPHKRGGKNQWHTATESLVWLSMACGFDSITEKNVEEVAERVRMWQHVSGTIYRTSSGDLKLSLSDIHDHIGLTTNASRLTRTEFNKKLLDYIGRESTLARTSIDHQQRDHSYVARSESIVEKISCFEGVPDDIDLGDQLWHWFETAEDIGLGDDDIAAEVAARVARP